jgi:hypothetical protein
MNQIRIREAREPLPGEVVQTFTWPNPRTRRPKELRSARYERIQQELDSDKRRWFNTMVWGMQTTSK